MSQLRILLVGNGGREHALAWKMAQSPRCEELYCMPGNAGIADIATCVDIAPTDIEAITSFAAEKNIQLAVIGPEAPLVAGLADMLAVRGIPVFGPSQAAAQLEGSKGFMKDLCAKYNVPTGGYARFTDLNEARDYIYQQSAPLVVKADGLAAGKGVIIAHTIEEAVTAAENMLSGNAFGEAGAEIVVEEFLDGEEISYFALCDGETVLPFKSAQDHKQVGDGDTGPNTGGMGAYSPARLMTPELEEQVIDTIVQPVIDGMKAEGCPFTGVLFCGLMVQNGVPKVLEFNVRFGDPECQALMMRLDSDLVDILEAAASGNLANVRNNIRWRDDTALCVVMAAKGYPGKYEKGTALKNIEAADALSSTKAFHAGTEKTADGATVNTGGRVLGITALGGSVAEARKRAYDAVDKIDWPDGFCRRDIGWRAVEETESEIDFRKQSISC